MKLFIDLKIKDLRIYFLSQTEVFIHKSSDQHLMKEITDALLFE